MITAIDTNILLDILVPNENFYEASANALQDAAGEGSLVISDIVYAELCIHFETQQECDAFLRRTRSAYKRWSGRPNLPRAGPESCRTSWSERTHKSRPAVCFHETGVS